MEKTLEEPVEHTSNPFKVFIGFLVGGIAGAVAMLLFAPQSGVETRSQIQKQTVQLRDRTAKNIKNVVSQVRAETGKLTSDMQDKAGELKQLGQEKLVKQLDRVSAALDNGKSAIEAA